MKTISAKFGRVRNQILVLIVASAAVAFASGASAQDILYTFAGTNSTGAYPYPANFIDGSTVTIDGGTITDFNIAAPGYGNFGTPATATITGNTVTSYDLTGWTGELDLTYGGIDIEVTGDSFTSIALGASIQGTYTATAVPEPNAFVLLGATVVGLAAWRPLRRRLI